MTTQTTDTHEINREIAERQGWKISSEAGALPILGVPPGSTRFSVVPNWAGNLNEAIQLKHSDAFLDLTIGWRDECIAAYLPISGYRHTGGKDKSPSMAICKAWIEEDDKRRARKDHPRES